MAEDPKVTECQLWESELAYIGDQDVMRKAAQFAIRTAIRAQCLADAAGTDALDELLDLRCRVHSQAGRTAVDLAIQYVQTDRVLSRDRDLSRQVPKAAARF
jgi:hypothetical protein